MLNFALRKNGRQIFMQRRFTLWVDILLLVCVLGSLMFLFLGERALFTPDEGRYAEIAREMSVSGDYITPYLNQIKYFEKPALFYWLGAGAIKLWGLNLWSLRSVNAFLGLLGCLIVYLTGRALYDRATGFLAALILGTSMLYFVMAHMISLDLPVTVFLTATLCAFIVGSQSPAGWRRRGYFVGASIAAALAVLSKGLIGIIFPIMIIGVWICSPYTFFVYGRGFVGRKAPYTKNVYGLLCLGVIFLLIAAPWHILVGLRNPEFFYFYFIEQHFLRYTTLDIGHYQPAWFFIPILMIGFFPWIVFLPQALLRSWKNKTDSFFLLWVVLVFLFFSFSKSKLIPYILPIFPPLAILTARYLVQVQAQTKHTLLSLTSRAKARDPVTTLDPAVKPRDVSSNCLFGIYLMAGVAWLFLISLLTAFPAYDTRTILPLATTLKQHLRPQDDIVTFNQYYQDLPFYLERRVSILNWKNELSFGMAHQETNDWMINDATFWQRWHSKRHVFVVLARSEYENLLKKHPNERFYVLNATITNLLISNYRPS
jgi:4-amino-4-deoxy-L-arabinose transferase-like glycosyltransferase